MINGTPKFVTLAVDLPEDPAELRTVSELLMAEVQSQAYQIEKLKGQLAVHQRARFGSGSESLDQLTVSLQEDEKNVAAAEMQKAEPAPGDECAQADQPAKRKHSRNPLPDHLDRVDEVLSPSALHHDLLQTTVAIRILDLENTAYRMTSFG